MHVTQAMQLAHNGAVGFTQQKPHANNLHPHATQTFIGDLISELAKAFPLLVGTRNVQKCFN